MITKESERYECISLYEDGRMLFKRGKSKAEMLREAGKSLEDKSCAYCLVTDFETGKHTLAMPSEGGIKLSESAAGDRYAIKMFGDATSTHGNICTTETPEQVRDKDGGIEFYVEFNFRMDYFAGFRRKAQGDSPRIVRW